MTAHSFKSSLLAAVRFLRSKFQPARAENSDPNVLLSIRLNSGRSQSAAWARLMANGCLELELYDFSDQAQSSLGNDVAWIWTVAGRHRSKVARLLEEKTGTTMVDDGAMLDTLAKSFPHVHAVRDWLVEKRIPVEENFVPWA